MWYCVHFSTKRGIVTSDCNQTISHLESIEHSNLEKNITCMAYGPSIEKHETSPCHVTRSASRKVLRNRLVGDSYKVKYDFVTRDLTNQH